MQAARGLAEQDLYVLVKNKNSPFTWSSGEDSCFPSPHEIHTMRALHSPMKRSLLFLTAGLCLARMASADPIISEFLASNDHGIKDEDGERGDWIEIHNPDATAVNLAGWHLTDNASNKAKWTFPAVSIPSKGFLLVWADSKNRTNPAAPLHTNFALSAGGEYLGLTRPDNSVSHEYAPTYPQQVPDIAYGVPVVRTETVLSGKNSPAKLLVPTDGSLGSTWTGQSFSDTSWQDVTTGIGYAVPDAPAGAVKLWADSVAEFSGVQGQNNWYYGYWNKTTDTDKVYTTGDVTIFAPAIFVGGSWDLNTSGAPWTQLAAGGGHPNGINNAAEHWTVRRYVSEFTGQARFVGTLQHPTASDGVSIRVMVDGNQVYYRPVANSTHEFSVKTQVQIGQVIDFVVDAGPAGNDGSDSFSFNVKVYSGAIADSVADWSTTGTQGSRAWSYGYYRKSADTDGIYQKTDFTSFLRDGTTTLSATNGWNGTQWAPVAAAPPVTTLTSTGGTPALVTGGIIDWPIRRWTATSTGRIHITGALGHFNAGSDGVTGRIYYNGAQVYSSAANNVTYGYSVLLDVVAGGTVDFAIDPNATETADTNAIFTAVIAPATVGASIVANSFSDYGTGVQGTNGWTYGYYNKTTDANGVYDASDLTTGGASWVLTGGNWTAVPTNPYWTKLNANYGHPSGNTGTPPQEHWPVRRWTSTVSGSVSVDWNLAKSDPNGNGTSIKIFHNGVERDSGAVAGNDRAGLARTAVLTNVQVGDTIDVALTPTGPSGASDDGSDGSYFSARILYNSVPPNSTLTAVADSIADWSTAGVQGFKNWTYGYYNLTTDSDHIFATGDFTPFPRDAGAYSATNYWDGGKYDWFNGNPPWTELGQTAVHPNGTNNTNEHWIIRRWSSTYTGSMAVTYKVNKGNPSGGGVSIRAFHNGVQKDFGAIAGTDTTGITRTFLLPAVNAGDQIDIALTPVGLSGGTDDGADGCSFSAVIYKVTGLADSIGTTGNVQSLMQNVNASAYLRVPFTVPSLNAYDTLKLNLSYDDGFAAYLNGQALVSRNAPVAATGGVLANSIAEFSGVQGQANWFYGYWNGTADSNSIYESGTDFNTADPNWSFLSGQWQLGPGNPPWSSMYADGGHPDGGGDAVRYVMRRWVAETDGKVTAYVRLYRPAGGCGTGTTLHLYQNGKDMWSQTIANGDTTGYWVAVQLPDVKMGDHLDLALDPTGTDGSVADSCDNTFWSMTVEQQPSTGLAWNSSAATARSSTEIFTPLTVDLTPQIPNLTVGTNVLAIQGMNAGAGDSDFLIFPELIGTITTADANTRVYLTSPTPSGVNGLGSTAIGPLITDATDSPIVGDADDIHVTAKITPTLFPVSTVKLFYRTMYGAETELGMVDDGTAFDGAANDGVYGAVIPASASTPGQMVRWRIIADDNQAHLTKSPTYADPINAPEYWGTVVTVPNVVAGGQLPILHWFTSNTSGADNAGGSRGSIWYNNQFLDNVKADLHGQSSSGFPKKSYDFNLNTSFKLAWDATPNNDTPKINGFNLLTTYPDKSNMRNMLSYGLYNKSGVPGHWVQPVQVRRNNAFFSVAHMVEDGDEDYLQRAPTLDQQGALYKMYNTFFDASGGEKKSRKWEGNSDLVTFIANLSATGVTKERILYDQAGVPEMINYLTATVLTSNTDLGHKNYYVYRDSVGNGEWRVLPWDVDLSFGRVWTGGYFDDTMYGNTPFYIGGGNKFMTPFMDNSIPAFKQMYLRRLRTLSDQVLQSTSVPVATRYLENEIINWNTLVQPDADYERLSGLWSTWGTPQTMTQGVNDIVNTYLPARRAFVFAHADLPAAQSPTVVVNFGAVQFDPVSHNQAEEYFVLTNPNAEAVDVSGWVVDGAVQHTLKPGTVIPAGGSLYLSPNVNAFRARTVSPKGNEGLFVQGDYNGQLSARGETLTLWDGVRQVSTITYTGAPTLAQSGLRVSELNYNPGAKAGSAFANSEYEYVEVQNTGAAAIPLTGVKLTAGVDFTFTSGTLAPGGFAVVAKNLVAFAERYPSITPAGVYTGSLDNAGERITLLDDHNEEILDFEYSPAWHPLTNGQGFSLQIMDPLAATDEWNHSTQWKPSGKLHGTPGTGDVLGDADSDGMPDLWEVLNGLNPLNAADAVLDPDGDGQNNLAEYLAGTDPRQVQSVLAATGNGFNGTGGYTFSFQTVAGKSYTVQWSATLEAGDWHKMEDVNATASETKMMTDPAAGTSARRFYRIMTPAQP